MINTNLQINQPYANHLQNGLNSSYLNSTNQSCNSSLNHQNQSFNPQKTKNSNDLPPSPVLLVCIYNKTGKIITHDYFYENFAPCGEIVKILIFQKAKVWKTFVEFRTVEEAQRAKQKLNNKVVFQDGSKMNIFFAKLRSIELQNSNLGGVNYEKLNSQAQSQQQKPLYWIPQYQWQNSYDNQHGMISYHPEPTYMNSSINNINNGELNYENYNYNQNAQINYHYNYDCNYEGLHHNENYWQNDQQYPQTRNRRSTLGGTPNQRNHYQEKNASSNFNKYYIHSPMVLHTSRFSDQQYQTPKVQGYQSSHNSVSNQNLHNDVKACSFKNQFQNHIFSPQANRIRANSQIVSKQENFNRDSNEEKNEGFQFNLFPELKFNSNVKSTKFQCKKDFQQKSFHSLFCDADQQFRQIAQESKQYQEWKLATKDTNRLKISTTAPTPHSPNKKEQNNIDDEKEFHNRRKSVTVNYLPHSHTEQFIQQNIPSKVLFIRSIPSFYTPQMIYNIFSNFGQIIRVIYMRNKMSSLIQYTQIEDAIQAKDELNYSKCEIRVFYSHYQTLMNRYSESQQDDCQQFICYLKQKSYSQSSFIGKQYNKKAVTINPPSDTLYLTQLTPENQDQLYDLVQKTNKCKIVKIQWKQQKNTNASSHNSSFSYTNSVSNKEKKNTKNTQSKSSNKDNKQKWMCLIQLKNINQSLLIMGVMQGYHFKDQKDNKQLKISFTRSKISGMGDIREKKQKNIQIEYRSPQRLEKQSRQSKKNESNKKDSSPESSTEVRIRNRWHTVSFKSVPECDEQELEMMVKGEL